MRHDIIIMIDRKYWISFANGFLIFLNMTDEIDSEKFIKILHCTGSALA